MMSTSSLTQFSPNNAMKRISIIQLLTAIALLADFTTAQISVIGGLSYDRDARAGEKYEGSFIVKNDTEEPQEAKIYQRDYTFSSDGTNVYGEPGKLARSNARWITFSPPYVLLPPHASITANYVVAVPKDSAAARLTGSYWSMMMVEGIPVGSPESSIRRGDSTKTGFFQNIRYAVQIATHITNTGNRAVRFIDAKLVKQETGERVLQVDLENTGDLFMRPDVYIELFDAGGQSRGKIPGARFRMYPGTSVRQTIQLKDIPAGTYKALVVVDAGGQDVFGAQYTLQF
jgi:hypothetical protein